MKAVYDAVYTYYGEPADAGVPYDGGFIVSVLKFLAAWVLTGIQIS
jgi:hypothetical protein